jgi:hypothetical protein
VINAYKITWKTAGKRWHGRIRCRREDNIKICFREVGVKMKIELQPV